jgi:hypothetical protein
MKVILAIFLIASLSRSYAQTGNDTISDCKENVSKSGDVKLKRLAAGFNRNDLIATRCALSYMDDLSKARDQRAMAYIVQYLDLQRPEPPGLLGAAPQVSHMEMMGGQYPALTDILRYGIDALPVLVKTISDDSGLSLNTKNAVRVIMVIESHDPPSGIKLLVEAAKENRANTKILTEAAQFAATLYQCKNVQSACNRIAEGQSE